MKHLFERLFLCVTLSAVVTTVTLSQATDKAAAVAKALTPEAPVAFSKVRCLEIEQTPPDSRINISLDASRLSFYTDDSAKNYAQIKALLMDVCDPKKEKFIDLAYDPRTQSILTINYHK